MSLIAIPPCSRLPDYEESVPRSGGEPWVPDRASRRPADVVRTTGGLRLGGDWDVNPLICGEAPHPAFAVAKEGRNECEIKLTRRALEADLPVLAICRGVQVLNVPRGGTLIQDIPTQIAGALEHRLAVPPHESSALAHGVWFENDSLLTGLLRDRLGSADGCQVNSRHRKAVKSLGEGLTATATAPDGLVEAVENPRSPFCLGVQWHPETFW